MIALSGFTRRPYTSGWERVSISWAVAACQEMKLSQVECKTFGPGLLFFLTLCVLDFDEFRAVLCRDPNVDV